MYLKKKILILTLAWVAFPWISYSQEVEELVKLYFNEVRAGKYPAVPKQLSLAENSKNTLITLTTYLDDSSSAVRSKAYSIAHLAGGNARQEATREKAVENLLKGCKDNDSGNVGLVLEYLTNFYTEDFNTASKDSIRRLFMRKPAHFDKLIKLIGFLELKDLTEQLRTLTTSGNPRQIRWASIVSLARMNDPAAQRDMMSRVKKLPTNDDVVYELFPDLVYTRYHEAINYMVEIMHSDAKNCTSADAERDSQIPCGFRIMEQLAPAIKGYPLDLDESGDIKSKDYQASLASVRHWFTKHTNYEILRDRY
jgi:hypothetical protein